MGWFLNEYNFATRKEVIKDWLKYPELIWLDRFQFNCGAVDRGWDLCTRRMVGNSLAATGDFRLAITGLGICGVHRVLLIHATLCINSLAHHYGSRDFDTDDHSRNNLFLSIITLGEGWHNNHHYYAGSTRQGFYWWQIDVTYYLLKIMSWLGIVWDLKPIPARVYDASKIAQARKQRKVAKTGTPTIHSKESP